MNRDRKSFRSWVEFAKCTELDPEILEIMYQAWVASKAFYLSEVERFVGMRLDEIEAEAEGEKS